MFLRTFCWVKMNDLRLWLAVATLHTLLLTANGGNHRRSTHGGLPASKGGWRPVVGSGGVVYSSIGTSQLHAPSYKIPVPVIDSYPSSARPLVARDATKLTSIAQSYRPTTHRTVPSPPPANQPVNTYHNPLSVQNNGYSSYKFIQNFPVESVLVRNPHNPFPQRPVYSKYPNKFKQNSLHNAMLQQLTNIQPIQFGQYQTAKPLDLYGNPIDTFAWPDGKRPQILSSGMEIFKPEVFKLPDAGSASQSISQQVKTAQQHGLGGTQNFVHFPQYSFQDALLPPNILGSFGSFGIQSVKGRDPVYQFPTTKTTYLPPQPNKETIFNSFSYNPNFKSTQNTYSSTTPRLPTTQNQLYFGTTFSDYTKATPAPQTKAPQYNPPKIDPNAGLKDGFKPSPQDPFSKVYHQQSDFNKISVTTYNPVQTSTLASNYFDQNYQQQNQQFQNFQNQYYNSNQKQNVQDSLGAGDHLASQQYASAPIKSQLDEPHQTPYKATYEVTETTESDDNTHTSAAPWTLTSQSYEYNKQNPTEESNKQEFSETLGRPATTTLSNIPEEFSIVTEAEKGHDNSLGYDGQVESQSRRPLGDDFEPIGMHQLKDYYYKVSTPSYNEFSTSRRTKKPYQAAKLTTIQETTTPTNFDKANQDETEALPTLPPNLHFKRPSSASEPLDKDKIRKRNKIRRRRPPLANINRNKEETTTRSTSETPQTTQADEVYTIRPRVRPTKAQPQPDLTTPTVTTDLTTSALPTITPTIPTTIVKKKLVHRRPLTTTTDRADITTHSYFSEDINRDSQIMKIGSHPQFPKITSLKPSFDFKLVETPDFTHKQDEKDTPTSDVSVSLMDTLKTTAETEQEFSFHKDVKPIEAKLETATNRYRESTTDISKDEDTTVTTLRAEDISNGRINRPRLRNKYNNRNRFNVNDYRNRLSSTTSTTEKPVENTPKIRYPQRRIPYNENINENESTTERKRFTPKDPRHKPNGSEINEQEIHSLKQRHRTTAEHTEVTTARILARIRNGQRRPKPTEETTETSSATTPRRPLRKKVKDPEIAESENVAITETTVYERNDLTSERTRSESAIMKIADKKHQQDHLEHLFEHSRRVSDLTLAASKDYNKPGMFKTVATNSRRIPNYFTIATDDPILPIEAFFPQLNQKKES